MYGSYGIVEIVMKKVLFKKISHNIPLFKVDNFEYDGSRKWICVSHEVQNFAEEKFGLDLSKPKDFESFLRKMYRKMWVDTYGNNN